LGAEFHGSLLGRQTITLRLAPVDLNQSPACHCQTPPAIRRGERRFGHATSGISRQMVRFRVFFWSQYEISSRASTTSNLGTASP
jgi:hypothetical protein